MDTQSPVTGDSGFNSGRSEGATLHLVILGTQQQCRHKLVHHNAANAATKHMTLDAQLKIVCKTGRSKNKKHHAVKRKYVCIEIHSRQLTVYRTAGVGRELRNE